MFCKRKFTVRKSTILIAMSFICLPGLSADWLTDGGNPQRTNWQKNEKILTTDNVKNMKLLWKLKLDNQHRQMHSLFPPLIIGSVNTPGGAKQMAIVAGSSDNIYAIDVDQGEVIWKRRFDSTWTPPPGARTPCAFRPSSRPAPGFRATPADSQCE